MPASEETAVVARYLARHNADIACGYLEDQGIRAYVIADDVHVPLQFTEGVRLVVMESDRERAHGALADAGLLPEDMTWDGDGDEDDQDEEAEDDARLRASDALFGATSGDGWSRPGPAGPFTGPKGIVRATTVAFLLVTLVFFIPWRVESSNELAWAPVYRPPLADHSMSPGIGGGERPYASGSVAYGALLLQLAGIVVAGWVTSVVVGVATDRPRTHTTPAAGQREGD